MLHLQAPLFFRLYHVTIIAVWIGLTFALFAQGQVSPDDHEKHHPPAQDQQEKRPPPAQGTEKKPAQGEMGSMMSMMGAPPPKELYPTLMELPQLSPEKRAEVQRQAHERMQAGGKLLTQGLERLSKALPGDDYETMQESVSQIHEGLAIFESGLSARRALAEGKGPQEVALQWFKREMSVEHPVGPELGRGIFGLSWFHVFVMIVLIGFSVAMIGIYFSKMRRAALLLQALTGGAPFRPHATSSTRESIATP